MIAAAAAQARRRVLGAFRQADATAPERAIGFTAQRRMERRFFERLVDFGAIVETSEGRFYLDEAKVAEQMARQRRRAFKIMGGILAASAAVIGLVVGLTQA